MPFVKEIKAYEHQGVNLGQTIQYDYEDEAGKIRTKTYFQPKVDALQVSDMVNALEPEDRVHLRTRHYGLFRVAEALKINPVSEEDVMICAIGSGAHSLTELYREDRKVWDLVRKNKLINKLFPEPQPVPELDVSEFQFAN